MECFDRLDPFCLGSKVRTTFEVAQADQLIEGVASLPHDPDEASIFVVMS